MRYVETKEKVLCVGAATQFYKIGEVYTVYKDTDGVMYVKGADGFYDKVQKTLSKFIRIENASTKQQGKRKKSAKVDTGSDFE